MESRFLQRGMVVNVFSCLCVVIKTKHDMMKEYENLHHKYLLEREDGAKHRFREFLERRLQR